MTLQNKQSRFVFLVGKLIDFAYNRKYAFTFGDAARMDEEGHKPNSFHYRRLAIDLNLFVNGKYKDKYCAEWQILGDHWKSLDIDCTWGGDFEGLDYNHFSFGERE